MITENEEWFIREYTRQIQFLREQLVKLANENEELTIENHELKQEKYRLRKALNQSEDYRLLERADAVQKMQSMIKEECIKGGIWPAFVAGVVERVGKKLLEENQ